MMLFVWWCQWRHLTWLWLRSQDVKCRGRRGNQKLDFIIHYTTNRISKGVQKDENSITLYKYILELCFLFVFAPLHKHWKHVSIIQQLYKRNHVFMFPWKQYLERKKRVSTLWYEPVIMTMKPITTLLCIISQAGPASIHYDHKLEVHFGYGPQLGQFFLLQLFSFFSFMHYIRNLNLWSTRAWNCFTSHKGYFSKFRKL